MNCSMEIIFAIFLFEVYSSVINEIFKLKKNIKLAAFVQDPYIDTVQNNMVDGLEKEVNLYWPKGVVNYYFDKTSYGLVVEKLVKKAINVIQLSSCIKFNLLSSHPVENISWIHITNKNKEKDCVHEPTVISNEIILVLGYECISYKEVLHALLHGVGLKDEVTHPHRDKYIRVMWDNIQPGYRHLYRKQPADNVKNILEFDPLSVMQFHDYAFSMNGRPTITPLESGLMIYPSENLSQLDRMRLQSYFGHECNKRKVNDILDVCKWIINKPGTIHYRNTDANQI